MRRFIINILLFFAIVALMDLASDYFFSTLRVHAKGGSTENSEYIAHRSNDDVIILGSSRATHHYIPQIIEDSLGVSCYNCGEEGNGIVLAYGRYKMLTNRYKPKLILYEVTPGYDYGSTETGSKYLGYLRPYYGIDGIKELFDVFDGPLSFIKMRFAMFRNTGRILPNVVDNIITRDNHKGYTPLFGTLDPSSISQEEEARLEVDSLKLLYVEKLIVDAKNKDIPLVFMISPAFGEDNTFLNYKPAMDLCKEYDIPIFNYLNYSPISSDPSLFQDVLHMNNRGATVYSSIVTHDVLDSLLNNRE